MTHWETLWQFHTANFKIEWSIAPCDDLDLSWDETGETQANLESGYWQAFDSRVRVLHQDTGAELGCDYLGQSIYENPGDFRKEHGGYFSDMVRAACTEARAAMHKLKAIPLHAA